jgi:hypothetical protein
MIYLMALTSALTSSSTALGQYLIPSEGMVRGPDGLYYPKHRLGESYKRIIRDYDQLYPLAAHYNRVWRNAQKGSQASQQRLGAAVPAVPEFNAPNLGIAFTLVRIGDAAGARLTRLPMAKSAAGQLRLEPGDTIIRLDGLPIRAAVDVLNHHGDTEVVFINVRTGLPQSAVVKLPDWTPPPPGAPREYFAANLGIHFQLIAYNGDWGARLSRTASAGTPAGALKLERGDMIMRLDEERIKAAEDVGNHVDLTRIELIDIRTGKHRTTSVPLPGPEKGIERKRE